MASGLADNTTIRIGLQGTTPAKVLIEPHIEFLPGHNPERTLSGGSRWQGSPRCRWTYPDRLLTGEQFHQLQNLVGDNPTVAVVMDVPTQRMDPATYQPAVVTYNAIMHWPQEEVMMESAYRWRLPDDGILFTDLRGA